MASRRRDALQHDRRLAFRPILVNNAENVVLVYSNARVVEADLVLQIFGGSERYGVAGRSLSLLTIQLESECTVCPRQHRSVCAYVEKTSSANLPVAGKYVLRHARRFLGNTHYTHVTDATPISMVLF